MNFCEKCGNRLGEGAKFCGKCGAAAGGQSENVPAPAACAKCGARLEEGEIFCSKCGAKVNAAPQNNTAPVQTQAQDTGGEVLKECELIYILYGGFKWEKGNLLLYRDRLGWKGNSIFVIPVEKISSIKFYSLGRNFKIILNNGKKYDFGYIGLYNMDKNKELKSFCDTINNSRYNAFNNR